MHNNDIRELRNELFQTLRNLREKKIDIETAKAINQTAAVIIDAAKVEVDHIRVVGTGSSEFISNPVSNTEKTATGIKRISSLPGGSITTHKMD